MENENNYLFYAFDPSSYLIHGPFTLKEAIEVRNYNPRYQILKLVVDENGKVV